jgi:glycine amidinotransferase/scyllo-inosamine-4-phosphate amidinotransferase 1
LKLDSQNEWDPLKAVIVGTVDKFSPGLEFPPGISERDRETASRLIKDAYPQWYLDEVSEDLDGLCSIFRDAGVEVFRPQWIGDSTSFATPDWSAMGFDIYNVRDLHIVFGNLLIESAPSSRFRLFQTHALRDIFYRNFFDDGFRWVSAPTPRLRGEFLHEIQRPRSELEAKEDRLHREFSRGLSERFHRLDEDEIIFDAANIIRLGADVLFLISSTGNAKAATWLSSILGPAYNVHITNAYRSSHLDSTIMPLRSGIVLMNGARVDEHTAPSIFGDWDTIFFTDVAPLPEAEVEFHRNTRLPIYGQLKKLGVESTLEHISSAWAGLNVVSIDPTTVLVHDRQERLIRVLETKGFTVIPVRMRHCYTMLGGLHCTTLDVVRKS